MLSIDQAHSMIRAAEEKAKELGVPMSIAVVHASGDLQAFSQMDGALPASADAARRKAFTAAVSGMSTAAWFDIVSKDPAYATILGTSMPGTMFLPGAEPILVEGKIAGAFGVSGGIPDQDNAAVAAALASI